jgi:tRNA C32,U32 (ribose-2'-O)-methylase TrmJ
MEEPTASSSDNGRPGSILMLHNVAKKKNFGELIRTAAAMGVSEIVVVGAQKLVTHGCHGTAGYVRFSHFDKFPDAVAYLRDVKGATITGVEITPDAKPVHKHPFKGTTCFLMGNEGQGLTDAQMASCSDFVYIPQHSDATASLNVNAACAVVLHHFAIWSGLPEAARGGYKFTQGPTPQSTPHSGMGLKQMRSLNADGSVAAKKGRMAAGADDDGAEGGTVEEEMAPDPFDDDEGDATHQQDASEQQA